jgi:hypothetical protein
LPYDPSWRFPLRWFQVGKLDSVELTGETAASSSNYPWDITLRQIGALYKIEEDIREKKLSGEAKRLHRLTHSKPLVERFFAWVDQQFESQGFLPGNPLTQALAYACERRDGLKVFLGDPDVPMDTNHLERSLRPVPLGRRNAQLAFMRSRAMRC